MTFLSIPCQSVFYRVETWKLKRPKWLFRKTKLISVSERQSFSHWVTVLERAQKLGEQWASLNGYRSKIRLFGNVPTGKLSRIWTTFVSIIFQKTVQYNKLISERDDRRAALKLQHKFLQVLRRVVLVRLKELCGLEILADKKERTRKPNEVEPMRLAENLRDVHQYVCDAW